MLALARTGSQLVSSFLRAKRNGRGDELLVGAYMYLDLTPWGRNETIRGNLTDWVRHHDRYGASGHVDQQGRYVASQPAKVDRCLQSASSANLQGET